MENNIGENITKFEPDLNTCHLLECQSPMCLNTCINLKATVPTTTCIVTLCHIVNNSLYRE